MQNFKFRFSKYLSCIFLKQVDTDLFAKVQQPKEVAIWHVVNVQHKHPGFEHITLTKFSDKMYGDIRVPMKAKVPHRKEELLAQGMNV